MKTEMLSMGWDWGEHQLSFEHMIGIKIVLRVFQRKQNQ